MLVSLLLPHDPLGWAACTIAIVSALLTPDKHYWLASAGASIGPQHNCTQNTSSNWANSRGAVMTEAKQHSHLCCNNFD